MDPIETIKQNLSDALDAIRILEEGEHTDPQQLFRIAKSRADLAIRNIINLETQMDAVGWPDAEVNTYRPNS